MFRHTMPIVSLILLLLVARQLYPYVSGDEANVVDGFTIHTIATNLGGPTCLVWADDAHLLICDRDSGVILSLNIHNDERKILLQGLDRPHGLALDGNKAYVSTAGTLTVYTLNGEGLFEQPFTLVEGIPTGNHQTNAVQLMPNGTLLWHSGSTCNICTEKDERNAALLWVNASTGEHGLAATGVRNSFDGVWVGGHGYFFTDNGRDWEGDHPDEELNFLQVGADYGWPNDDPEHPVPAGSLGPIGTWTPHTSLNGIDLRPPNSPLPGLSPTDGFTLYATVYGSWNTLLPQGHEILRIDVRFSETSATYQTEISRFAWDAGTPLPLVFHEDGTLFYATFGHGGTLYSITPTS